MKKQNLLLKYFSLFTIIISLFTLISCSDDPTKPKSASLSGNISLVNDSGDDANNPVDFSGITIALYNTAYLDTTIVRINNQYPQIGVHINQHTEFDHREQEALYTTETNADGSFSLSSITPKTYNLVAMKEGWGWRYVYEISLAEGNNSLAEVMQQSDLNRRTVEQKRDFKSEKGKVKRDIREKSTSHLISHVSRDQSESSVSHFTSHLSLERSEFSSHISQSRSDLSLFPAKYISGTIVDNVTIEPFHHLVCEDDVLFAPGSHFELQPNSVCRIAGSKEVEIYGSVKMQGEEDGMFTVTTKDSSEDTIEKYQSIEINSNALIKDNLITYGIISGGTNSIVVKTTNMQTKKLIFTKNIQALYFNYSYNSIAENCLFTQNTGSEKGCIAIEECDSFVASKNIIINNDTGIYAKFCENILEENNYIAYNTKGIWHLTVKGLIEYNELALNTDADIKIAANTTSGLLSIKNNNLRSNISIAQYEQGSFNSFHRLNINFNNFYSESCFIRYDSSGLVADINATNNFYYFLTTLESIKERIIDTNQNYDILGTVIFEPYLIEPVLDTGIN